MVNVNPIQAQKYLKGADYPMSRDEVVKLAQGNDAPDEVVQALQAMDKDRFDGPNAVVAAMKDAGTTDPGQSRPEGVSGS